MGHHDLLIRNKKVAILLILFLAIGSSYSQISDSKSSAMNRHELHMNTFNLVAFKAPNVSYEYIVNENWSLGLGLLYKVNRQDPRERPLLTPQVVYRVYSVTSYVRRYFSRKYARGFFIEGFGMLNSQDGAIRRKIGIGDETSFLNEVKRYTHFAMGVTFGGKFLWGKKGFLLEVHFGYGIPGVLGQSPNGFGSVTRGGISLGYRF